MLQILGKALIINIVPKFIETLFDSFSNNNKKVRKNIKRRDTTHIDIHQYRIILKEYHAFTERNLLRPKGTKKIPQQVLVEELNKKFGFKKSLSTYRRYWTGQSNEHHFISGDINERL